MDPNISVHFDQPNKPIFAETFMSQSVFYTHGKIVDSFMCCWTKIDESLYEISGVTIQNESEWSHDVLNSGDGYAIYDKTRNVLLRDLFLYDKYGDGGDGWMSQSLSMFQDPPELIESDPEPEPDPSKP